MKKLWLIIPLMLFALFLGVAAYQLTQPRDTLVRSTMIGKPLPAFDLPGATDDAPRVASGMFADGQPRLLNVWATWCVPCRKEMPALDKLQETLGKPSETLERCLDLGGTGVDGRIFGL